MAYLLDSNVFIQAKNLHYGFDFCPAFWDWIEQQNRNGTVFSVEKVGTELAAGADDLAEWADVRGAAFFVAPDQELLVALAQVSSWVDNQGCEPAAVGTFFQVADYYLTAHAMAHSHTVVTHEIPSESIRKVKIPNVCIGLGVRCVTPFEMLRSEQARFVLGKAGSPAGK
ncbi:MAG: DUF4411 family protein [Thermoanaerobaculales bacterium]